MAGIHIAVHIMGPIKDKICVIQVTGSLGAESTGKFGTALNNVLSKGLYKIIVDLTGVDYITSAGWGELIGELREVREKGGDIKLCGMRPDVYEIFRLLEFDQFIQTFDTVKDAEREFREVKKVVSFTDEREKRKEEPIERKMFAPIALDLMQQLKYSTEIVKVVKAYPQYGPTLITRELNTAKYGFIKISRSTVYRRLRRMELNTKEKRVEFVQMHR